MFLFILIIECQYLNWPFLLLICIWALQLTFALTLWALALVNCFSLAAGMRMSQSVSRILPSSICALGKPMIVPCCCWKEAKQRDFSVYSFHSQFLLPTFQTRKRERKEKHLYRNIWQKQKECTSKCPCAWFSRQQSFRNLPALFSWDMPPCLVIRKAK